MSAWLVSKAHIDLLVYGWTKCDDRRRPIQFWHPPGETRAAVGDETELGRMLWRENMLSLDTRYGDKVDEDSLSTYQYVMRGSFLQTPIVHILKAIDCYEYQACEHDGWKTSEAKSFCTALRNALIGKLPGYDKAPWGVEDVKGDTELTRLF